ncbi:MULTISPECIES: hypothetical protein [unclassified Rickettsia]
MTSKIRSMQQCLRGFTMTVWVSMQQSQCLLAMMIYTLNTNIKQNQIYA